MAKAIDIGTAFIVGAEIKDGREVFTSERDAFFSMPKEDFAEEMLNDAGAYYITRGNHLFVIGEDALKFSMLTGNQAAYRRPMAKGVLNPGEEEAIAMLELLIEGIIGRASHPGEVCAATVPCAPCDGDNDTQFHKIVVERCLTRLGYEVKIVNEALGIIFHENPTVTSNGETTPFSGVGISFGAGMTNLVVAWRAKKLFEMSVARGGDWIDEKVAGVRGITKSKVTAVKERKLDLGKVDMRDAVQVALEIYYDELIRYTLAEFARQFKGCQASIDEPLEWVVAGGTARVPGFVEKFEKALRATPLPFEVKGVRLARDPLNAPAAGALIAALSHEKKKLAKSGDGAAEELAAAPSGRIGSKVDVGDGVDPSALLGREPAVPVAARAAAARPSGNGNGAKPRV
jgi:hypothetical protein